jgi:hypothetical protein
MRRAPLLASFALLACTINQDGGAFASDTVPPPESTGDADSTVSSGTGTSDTVGTDADGTDTDTDSNDASTGETSTSGASSSSADGGSESSDGLPIDPCSPDGEATIFECFEGCEAAMFTAIDFADEFEDPATFAIDWSTSWEAPQVQGDMLHFGPHPMATDWWLDYSPATTGAAWADVVTCMRAHVVEGSDLAEGDNTLELTVRLPSGALYETAGMVIGVQPNAGLTWLRTRIDDGSSVVHDTRELEYAAGVDNTLDVLVYGEGTDRFVAEVYNRTTDDHVTLVATATMAAAGHVSLLGWRNAEPARVERIVIGSASEVVQARLDAALP